MFSAALTFEQRRKGGLTYEPISDSSDSPEPMSEDDQVEEERKLGLDDCDGTVVEELIFPESTAWKNGFLQVSQNDSSKITVNREKIPPNLQSIAPHIIKGFDSFPDVVAKAKAGACFHATLPCVVHASPVVLMFENKAIQPTGMRKKVTMEPTYKSQFCSFTYSYCQLKSFKGVCSLGCIPFHPSITPKKLKQLEEEYNYQFQKLEHLHNVELDNFFAEQTSAVPAVNVRLLEVYALKVLNLMEYFIYSCLLEPYGVALEDVLTPAIFPSLFDCPPSIRERIATDVVQFFQHKEYTSELPNFFESSTLLERIKNGTPETTYKGYVPKETVVKYFEWLNEKK